jgi:hypothetical protein
MIKEYNLSFLNIDNIATLLLNINLREHGLLSDGKSSFNYGIPLLMHPDLNSINIIFKKYLDLYCRNSNIPEVKFINSWFNIANAGSKLISHNHGQNGLSGVFYISGKTPLIFKNRSIAPYPGLLIIFPSSFDHYTEEEKEQRIVISFNTKFL